MADWRDSGKDFWNTKMESLEQLGRYGEAEKCSDKGRKIFVLPKMDPDGKSCFGGS